jgi:hypothetical protein
MKNFESSVSENLGSNQILETQNSTGNLNNTPGNNFINFNSAQLIDHLKLMLRDIMGEEKAIELSQDLGYLHYLKIFFKKKNNLTISFFFLFSSFLGHILSHFIGWKDIRPWSEFFAVFKPPQLNWGLLEQRIATNFLHYRSNYFVLSTGIFTVRAIFSPSMLLSLLFCASLAIYLLLIRKLPIVIGKFTFRNRDKSLFLISFSILFLALTGALVRLIWTFLMMFIICGAHMLFRPRSVTAKTNELYEELKLNGYSWFVGTNSSQNFDPENPTSGNNNEGNSDTYAVRDSNDAIRKRNSGAPLANASSSRP